MAATDTLPLTPSHHRGAQRPGQNLTTVTHFGPKCAFYLAPKGFRSASGRQQVGNKPATSQPQVGDRPDLATVTHFEPALPPTQSPWEAARGGPGEAKERLRRGSGEAQEALERPSRSLERLRRRPKKPETRTSADPQPPGGSEGQKAALPPTQSVWEVPAESLREV